ncbi:cytochrome c [Bryobacterales bacterium F-183]|nr:cytochrome c [Bryobacterales bacterium F-183]
MKHFAVHLLCAALALGQAPQKRVFWSFRSPVKVDPPAAGGATNPIDAFGRAKLAEKGLDLAPKADSRTLLRRLYFDLAGLPPKPDELGQKYEDAMESLLHSRAYGERWGRYWLDVVRFGETDGGEHNYERFHAWPYRDYVIDAFQSGKPYNQFIREQIAGDLIDPKLTAATGFLVAGPWDQVSAELNKDKTLQLQARMDELDDMVTTTFHTFQGLTVNCARCHDHKFDPIPSKDYYRLTDVFQTVGFGTRTVATQDEVDAWKQKTAPIRERLQRYEAVLADIEQPVRAKLLYTKYRDFDQGRDSAAQRLPLNPIWNRNFFAPAGAKRFRFVITGHKGDAPKLERFMVRGATPVEWGEWTGKRKASTENPYVIELPFSGRFWEITWSSDRTRGSSNGMITVYRFEASDDGFTWRTVASSLDHVGANELDLPMVSTDEILSQLSTEQKAQRLRVLDEIAKIKAELAEFPEPRKLYSAVAKPGAPSYLLERGSVAKPKEQVHAGTLTAIAQLPNELPEGKPARLALADWIASPENPLTARVIVNRVWYYHFGRGLVNTPSDFGLSGDRPSHPELLDWLAVSFVEKGWDLKWLHRLILTSDTYQQSSAYNEKAAQVDADNRLLWHMPLRRMDAETLRDSMLAVTGNLQPRDGGPGYMLQKKGDAGSYIYKALDNDGPEVWGRSVYRFVVRGGERIMLDSFDCPDPSVATPQRSLSNTPVQALTLLNNPFVLRQASLLAARVAKEEDKVGAAYRLLFQRAPSDRERELAAAFLKDQSLDLYCRVLFNSNEFLYVP